MKHIRVIRTDALSEANLKTIHFLLRLIKFGCPYVKITEFYGFDSLERIEIELDEEDVLKLWFLSHKSIEALFYLELLYG